MPLDRKLLFAYVIFKTLTLFQNFTISPFHHQPFYEFWEIIRYFLRRSGKTFRPKVRRKKYHCLIFLLKKKRIYYFVNWASFDARILGSKSKQKSTWLISPFYLRRTVIPFAKNTRGWYHLFIFDALWFHLRKIQHECTNKVYLRLHM